MNLARIEGIDLAEVRKRTDEKRNLVESPCDGVVRTLRAYGNRGDYSLPAILILA